MTRVGSQRQRKKNVILEHSSLLPTTVEHIFRARHAPPPLPPGGDPLVLYGLCNFMNLEFR